MFTNYYRFKLNPALSPTFYQLHQHLTKKGWRKTRLNYLADLSEKNFEFHSPAANQLEYKHFLTQLVNEHCPEVMPETFQINDTNWPHTLERLMQKGLMHSNWILKPALLNNGQHIKIFSRLSQIEQHYLSFNRVGGEHVLQQYITSPHLLKNHKYSIRMFVVMTNYMPPCLYSKGYLNVSLSPYQETNFNEISAHLTNEHLKEETTNVVQIPTDRLALFTSFYPQIKSITTKICQALKQYYPDAFVEQKGKRVALFGFDFIVDAMLRVWLLEVNHGPCFPISDAHPLQHYFYDVFWQAIIDCFILPLVEGTQRDDGPLELFEPLI